MKRPITYALVCVVAGGGVSLGAQWPKYQVPGVPRDARGAVQADAPAPRTADGKPDLSGNWMRADGQGLAGRGRGAAAQAPPPPPADPNSPPVATFGNLGAGMPGG